VHAVDAKTGQNLWTFNVPEKIKQGGGGADGAFSVYVVNGREYVIGVFGGSAMERHLDEQSPVGDAVIAFALPQNGSAAPAVPADPPRPGRRR
jgi:glucose dehydrogenase